MRWRTTLACLVGCGKTRRPLKDAQMHGGRGSSRGAPARLLGTRCEAGPELIGCPARRRLRLALPCRAERRSRPRKWASLSGLLVALALLPAVGARAGDPAQPMTTVTLDDLFPTRIIEVDAGTEVVFSDPRLLRVEMVPDAGAPVAEPVTGGFSAVFRTPGTFRFLSTVVGVERAGIVPCQVIVRPRPGGPALFDFAQAKPGVTEAEFRSAQEHCLHDPRTAGFSLLYLMCMQARGVQPIE